MGEYESAYKSVERYNGPLRTEKGVCYIDGRSHKVIKATDGKKTLYAWSRSDAKNNSVWKALEDMARLYFLKDELPQGAIIHGAATGIFWENESPGYEKMTQELAELAIKKGP